MADKRICPVCNAYTSACLDAFDKGLPCPHCGISAAASAEIEKVRKSQAHKNLKERLEVVLVERDAARAELALLNEVAQELQAAHDEQGNQLEKLRDRLPAIREMIKEWQGSYY